MRTLRTSLISLGLVAMFFGCVVNTPPVTPTNVPAAPDAGAPSVPDATVPPVTTGGSSGMTQAPPDAGTTSTPPTTTADAGAPCLQRVMCTKDKHFDTATCACVAGTATPQRPDGGACVQVTMCMSNMHFDTSACTCVKN
jgi:hypothetical protein